MTEALIQYQTKDVPMTPEDIKALMDAGIIPEGTPNAQIKIFAQRCREMSLSPFKSQIYLVKRIVKDGNDYKDRYISQVGIDGYRAQAERSGQYAGGDDYLFDEGLTEYEMRKAGRKKPETATATIYKMISGHKVAYSATAAWDEYFPGEKMGFMWKKMPFNQLGKCAEAKALRKGFPDGLSGTYIREELENIEQSETKQSENSEIIKLAEIQIDEFTNHEELHHKSKAIVTDLADKLTGKELLAIQQKINEKYFYLKNESKDGGK